MRKFCAVSAILAALASSASAQDDAKHIRFIHAVPGAAAVSISLGDTKLFDAVAFKTITPWKPLSGDKDAKLVITTADGKQVETKETFEFDDDGENYTIIGLPAKDGSSNPHITSIKSDRDDDNDEAAISLINASVTVHAADLHVGTDRIHAGVNYAEQDGPDDVAVGDHVIKVTDGSTGGADKTIATIPLAAQAGKSYTAVVFGPMDAVLVDDANPSMAMKGGATMTTGTRRMDTDSMATTGTSTMDATMTPASSMMTPADSMMTPASSDGMSTGTM